MNYRGAVFNTILANAARLDAQKDIGIANGMEYLS
jgi:hypothetical protein